MIVLVTGGARSGKSAFALARTEALAPPDWLFIATAEPRDDEMRARIAEHRRQRRSGWITVEAPLDPAAALGGAGSRPAALVDCVTLWLSNLIEAGRDDDAIEAAVQALVAGTAATRPLVLVTNEVGLGIVPEHPLARRYRDLIGRVNQRIAAAATEVHLLVCGQPLRIK